MPKQDEMTEKSVALTIKETIESLAIAFILAFVFRAFVVEAFVIPTGSMADGLRGAHYRITCANCSHNYNYGFSPDLWHLPEGGIPSNSIEVVPPKRVPKGTAPRCQLCGEEPDKRRKRRVSNGDRILVLKYLYQFIEPQTWDVVVFKNPTNPKQNYIKRLIGCPGDEIKIIDGDIYIDGVIQTKPKHVQDLLWLKIYDSDFQPANNEKRVNNDDRKVWRHPFEPNDRTQTFWEIDQKKRTYQFKGSNSLSDFDELYFNQARMKMITKATIDYNGPNYDRLPVASDLKFSVGILPKSEQSLLGITLGKYQREYRCEFTLSGQYSIIDLQTNESLFEGMFNPLALGKVTPVSFAILDHQFIVTVGDNEMIHQGPNDFMDWGYNPNLYSVYPNPNPAIATLKLSGAGEEFQIQKIQLHRDIYYTKNSAMSTEEGRATHKQPFELGPDEFFVLGDNSPASADSRFWHQMGKITGNDNHYRMGTVPRDYLIGKAFFVYWPAGYLPSMNSPLACIPNFGDMRFIK